MRANADVRYSRSRFSQNNSALSMPRVRIRQAERGEIRKPELQRDRSQRRGNVPLLIGDLVSSWATSAFRIADDGWSSRLFSEPFSCRPPFSMTTASLHNAAASSGSCVTTRSVTWKLAHSDLISSKSCALTITSKPAKGSSRRSRRGRTANARASATRYCCPADNACGLRGASSSNRQARRAARAWARRSWRDSFACAIPRITLSSAVRCGHNARS